MLPFTEGSRYHVVTNMASGFVEKNPLLHVSLSLSPSYKTKMKFWIPHFRFKSLQHTPGFQWQIQVQNILHNDLK